MRPSQGFITTIVLILGLMAQSIPATLVTILHDDPSWIAAGFPLPFAWEGPDFVGYGDVKKTGFSGFLLTLNLLLIIALAIVTGRKCGSTTPSSLTRGEMTATLSITIILVVSFSTLFRNVLLPL